MTELLEELANDSGTFSHDERKQIGQTLTAAGSATPAAKVVTFVEQEHLYVYNYYSDFLWTIYHSVDSFTNKLQHTADFWVTHLGLRYPSANTKRVGVATIHAVVGEEVDPATSYNHVMELQSFVTKKRNAVNGTRSMDTFPEQPDQFIRLYPHAFGDHPPVGCRVHIPKIRERCNPETIPVRCTAKRVRGKVTPGVAQAVTAKSDDSNTSMFRAMMQYMTGNGAAPPAPRPPPASPLPPPVAIAGPAVGAASSADGHAAAVVPYCPGPAGGMAGCHEAPAKVATAADELKKLRDEVAEATSKANKKAKKAKANAKAKGRPEKGIHASEDDDDEDGEDGEDDDENRKRHKGKASDDDGSDDAAETDSPKAAMKAMKAKGASPKAMKAKGASPKAMKVRSVMKKDEREAERKAMLKRPAAKGRPTFSKKPTSWHGGKIYFSEAAKKLRVYVRSPADKVERSVPIDVKDKHDKGEAWCVACALIESDPRSKDP